MTFDFQQIDGAALSGELLEEIGALRFELWNAAASNLSRTSPKAWLDRVDKEAMHFLVFNNDEVVAAARLSIHHHIDDIPEHEAIISCFPDWAPTFPVGHLGRLVVHPSARSNGIATKLDADRIDYCGSKNVATIVGAAISWRTDALKKLGFDLRGEVPAEIHGEYARAKFFMEKKLISDG